MISQSIAKVNLFLQSLCVKLEENNDIFKSILVTYKSGVKEYFLKIYYEDSLVVDYLGEKREIKIKDIPYVISKELDKYDSVVIDYIDRISTLEIVADNKNVYSTNKKTSSEDIVVKNSTVGGREYIIKGESSEPLLKAIGIMADNGKIKNDMVRKYNQIDRFIELISDIDFSKDSNILDCACGKSYLSFAVNYYVTEILKKKCFVYGIDYNEDVIKASNKIKEQLNYNNMQFLKEDLREFYLNKKIDLVISLHACDVATDYAIYSGIKHKSKAIICVPCCHKELSNQIKYEPFSDILKHGIFNRRFCDILTDALRTLLLEANGYKVSVIEYTSPLDTPKNIMLKAIKVSSKNEKALKKYYELKKQFGVNPTLEWLLTSDEVNV
ncbi:MAG: SAM-dependent methyltransferase [Ruminococcaceae bacterium]|nr:SAM-dependent methyltransferase [Oscillospiraceae bacterium]